MAYDNGKDKEFFAVKHKEGLTVSVHRYNNGAAKIQIGPREIKGNGGGVTFRKAGRLTIDEIKWIGTQAKKLEREIAKANK